MGVSWGDYDRDGHPDLFVTTYARQDKMLYHSQGRGLFRPVSVEAGVAGPTQPYVAFGGGFFDADNDGYLDLLIANGHVRDNAAALDSSQSYRQPLQLLLNQRNGTFADVSTRAGAPFARRLVGRGVAFGDYDGDGRTDALVVDLEGRALLLHNETRPAGHWLDVRLAGAPHNPDGIGARITVETSEGRQTREVTRGGSVLSANDVTAHFGLGSAARVEAVRVRWPGGLEEFVERPDG